MIKFQEIELFWKNQSREDLKTAEGLFLLGRYAPTLFFCHLTLEKFLKSLIVRETKSNAPFEHNLIKLSKIAKVDFSDNERSLISEINTFNIKGRYDDYKSNFYKKATKSYTKRYLDEAKRIIIWLKKQ
jgi:HEPN domain-containing protein